MLRGVVLVFVHAEHDGDVLVGGGCGDDDLLDRSLQVGLRLGGIGEDAGRLDHHLGADWKTSRSLAGSRSA